MTAPGPSVRYRFGEFELRPDQGELLRAGAPVTIQPQPLKVLTVLVAAAGSLVRRGDLVSAIWGDDTHVDFDRGLNFCIKQIRAALGDDAAEPRFVRTVPRYGYRFIADVETVTTAAAERTSATPPPRPAMRRAAATAGTAFALVLLTLGITWWFAPASSDVPTADPRALEAFLRGQHLAESGDVPKSLEHFERTIAIDPHFARGHLGLALAWARMPGDPAANASRSRAAVLRALELDPTLADGHAHVAALALYGDWDWDSADAAYRRTIELAPDSAAHRHAYANFLSMTGRHEAAIRHIERAMELDPVSTSIKADAGWFYYQARRFDEATRVCTTTLELDPTNQNAMWCLLQTHRAVGDRRDAVAIAARLAAAIDTTAPAVDHLDAFWTWYLGWLERHPAVGTPSHVGLAHLALGNRERALDLFEQAYATHSSCLLPVAGDPQVDPLRGDDRFTELLTRLDLAIEPR